MNNHLLITLEILAVVVAPLLFLYLKSCWPMRQVVISLMTIPILWYLTYAISHELSHIAGTYLVGGNVIDYKLIPRFWEGEFGRAWITSTGLTQNWQQFISTSFPYIIDIICILSAIYTMQRSFSRNSFVIGATFMFLCLRPAFDFICESIAFLIGDRGDFYCIQTIIGISLTWTLISFSLALSLASIVIILKRYDGFP